MKKYLPLAVVVLFVLCGLEAVAFHFPDHELSVWEQNPTPLPMKSDVLDQQQPAYDFFGPIGSGPLWEYQNYMIAQTFTPTKPVLTRVELLLAKNITTTYDYTVVIRESPTGADLTMASVPAGQIMTDNFSWIEFDFPDIMVSPGNSYFLTSYTINVTDNFYGWGLTLADSYPNGTVYFSVNDGVNWTEETDEGDMTFKTYGRENIPPNEPLITGEIEGRFGVEYPYNFSTDDLDGDDVYYWIDWGDDTPVDWMGPYASGMIITLKHTYKKRGTYTIMAKAKDPLGAESPYGYLEVTMPVNIGFIPGFFLQHLFERFPRAFPLLRQIYNT